MAFCGSVWSFLELAPHIGVKDHPLPSPTVPSCSLLSPAVFHLLTLFSAVLPCFSLFSTVVCSLLLSSTVLRRPAPPPGHPLLSPPRICLRSLGLLSFLITTTLEIQGRKRTALSRSISFGGLGSPLPGPIEVPDS